MFSIRRARFAGLALLGFVGAAQASVFINELHYDDSTASGDIGEMVEVVATAGEDLTQYSIVLYNGNTPTAAVTYGTATALPAGSTVTCVAPVKIAALTYPSNGIQNGPNDAIALVQGTTVVQFLSYEGVVTASNGPATGLVSTDIGVSETNSTVPGTSLQLGGNGNAYANFTWHASATATSGACNNGQTFIAGTDVAPSVNSTVPADTATGVAPTANVTINFSEPVTLGATWYDVSCDLSGPHAATVTGGPASYVLDPSADFLNNDVCTVSIDGSQVIDQDGTPDPMAANYRFGFSIASDAAPTVDSTTPADNAINVSSSTDLTIKFSEVVNVTGAWFGIVCANSGTHTATVSGGPSIYLLNPDVDFGAGENCVVTILAAQVSDQDGSADQMAANYQFHFTTAVGDAAPTVLRSTPVEGNASTPWAADISIFFSEPVSAPSSAFSISCALSGPHTFAFSVNAGNTRALLNPDADFAVSEACTVTVDGTQVFDMDGTPNPIGANFVLNFTTQPLATNYYAGVDASTCTTLRTTLHNRIKDHVAYMYSPTTGLNSATATWNILEDADEDPTNPAKVLDIYRNHSYTKVTDRSGSTDASHYNREHTWPNSHGFNDLNGLDALGNAYSPYTDTHMLYASASDFNANRGNNPYGNCASGCSENVTDNYAGFGGPGNSNWNGASVYEVWNHRKGDAARAVLYMDIRYEGGTAANGQPEPDLIVTDNAALITNTPSGQVAATGYMGLKTDLIQWANNDAPDALEQIRNDVIYSYQGNRNPFIDHPEWVNCLFSCQCNVAPPPDPMFSDSFE